MAASSAAAHCNLRRNSGALQARNRFSNSTVGNSYRPSRRFCCEAANPPAKTLSAGLGVLCQPGRGGDSVPRRDRFAVNYDRKVSRPHATSASRMATRLTAAWAVRSSSASAA
jgi:hypothetical protein